jgi:hypothetical protein
MIIIGKLHLMCVHLVDNRLEPRKYRINGLSNQLHKVLKLSTLGLKEYSFHMIVTLVESH